MSARRKPWESRTAFWVLYRNGAGVRLVVWLIIDKRLCESERHEFQSLAAAREAIPRGLTCIPRLENDHPTIIEVWL